MSNPAPNKTVVNLRNIRKALRSIITALFAGFALLLGLIWFIGNLGQWELERLQNKASEDSKAYIRRIGLANDIRIASIDVIERAKSYRAVRDVSAAKYPYKGSLNLAKLDLDKQLAKGRDLWGVKEKGLPPLEVAAWDKIEIVAARLWKKIEEEEKNQKEKTQKFVNESPQPYLIQPVPPQTAGPQTGSKEEFFEIRTEMDNAVKELIQKVTGGLDQTFINIEEQQAASARKIERIKWPTFIFGFIVAAFTIGFTQRQLTKTRGAERREQEEKGRKVAVFNSLSDDIVVINEQGGVVEVNPAFLKDFKTSSDELKKKDYRSALAEAPEIASFVEQSLQTPNFNQRQRERIEVKSSNGRANSSLYDVSVSPLTVGDEMNGRLVVIDDVTEGERLREELRLRRTLSAIGEIAAKVAHELYNPLGAVKLNLELLELQIGEDEDVKHTIGRLKRGVEHLSTIVLDLRDLTRPREPERKPTDLNNLLDEVVELASDRLERSRICIECDYSSEPAFGQFDPQQLRKVFLNLLINAVEATPQNGEVELRTRVISKEEANAIPEFNSSNGAITVSVIDRGVGMTAETKQRLFEAFYTTKRNGTGLGMMITQEIVKKHGGKIEVESEEGIGTKVSVYLPT